MTLLEGRDLAVIPPGSRLAAVEGFSIRVAAGDWLAITGPNGGGKTSLLLGLAGLWPTRGELRFDGAPFGPHAGRSSRNRLAVVLQDPSTQILQGSVREELAFGLRNQGLSEPEVDRRIREWADRLGLSNDLERDPVVLSAGRQQMVLLAAAMAGEPKLLLADEPTAHLDRETRAMVLDAIRREVDRGMAVVWVTQIDEELSAAPRRIEVGRGLPVVNVSQAAPPSGETVACVHVSRSGANPGDGPQVVIDSPLELPIRARGVTALTGRNGIGKSAILGAAAGHTPIPQVRVDWRLDPEPPPIAALQYPELQIFEEEPAAEVIYAAVSRGMAPDRALDLARKELQIFQMDRLWAGRRTWALSTGEKRILEVVSVLIAPASLYVLDEPTAGLDLPRKVALGQLVAEIATTKPVLIASQDVAWLETLGSHVVDLDSLAQMPSGTPGTT